MAQNALGVEVPAANDPFDPQGDMVELGASLLGRVMVPVANATARAAALVDAGSSDDDPLLVREGDTGVYWEHTPSKGWRRFAGEALLPLRGTMNTGSISGGGVSGPHTVTFSRPFLTTPTVLIQHDSGRVMPYQKVVSLTGFTFRLFNTTGDALATGSVDWIAVP